MAVFSGYNYNICCLGTMVLLKPAYWLSSGTSQTPFQTDNHQLPCIRLSRGGASVAMTCKCNPQLKGTSTLTTELV